MAAEDEEIVDENISDKEENTEVADLKALLEESKAESQKKSMMLRKMNNRLDALESAGKPKEKEELLDDEEKKPSDFARKIQDREDEREEKYRRRAKLVAISSALEDEGLKGADAKRVARLIEMEEGSKLVLDADDFEDYKVIGVDEGDGMSMKSWMGAYLDSDKGKPFRPSKSGPTPKGTGREAPSGKSGRKEISSVEYATLSSQCANREERKALVDKYEIVG